VTGGHYTHELHNTAVHSALRDGASAPRALRQSLPRFSRRLQQRKGKFGGISVVKMAKDMWIKPTAPFTDEPVDYSYPDGLLSRWSMASRR
jgi:hypothetical protein